MLTEQLKRDLEEILEAGFVKKWGQQELPVRQQPEGYNRGTVNAAQKAKAAAIRPTKRPWSIKPGHTKVGRLRKKEYKWPDTSPHYE
jgi:hypothetical protein